MTKVRRLIGAALAVALGAWAGVAVATRRPRTSKPLVVVEAASADPHDPVDRPPVRATPVVADPFPATLHFRLRSDVDGGAVSTRCELWRLGLPEDDDWTAGDDHCRTFDVPEEGADVGRLRPGRYRIHCLDLRHDAEDPPELRLSDGANERDVVVAVRREFRLRLLLVDDAGDTIAGDVDRKTGPTSSRPSLPDDAAPRWAHPRRQKSVAPPSSASGGSLIGCGPGGKTALVRSDGVFFDLGQWLERGRRGYEIRNYTYMPDARESIDVHIDDEIGVDSTFVGVAARVRVVVARVTCPDGSPLDPATATIETKCSAIRFPWTPPADAWRTVPVHVKIVKPGCEPLEFDWTAGAADAPHTLVASPSDSRK